MIPSSELVGPHLQAFFTEHLTRHKRATAETIASMRHSFRLFLRFLQERTGIEPAALRLVDLDVPAVLSFLDHLERERGNSVRSRNIRLSAIRSFMRLVALRAPDSLGMVSRVLAIPVKREDKKLVGYLSRPEMDAVLAAPDQTQWAGRRDYALLLTMYNSGARVSEITTLRRPQVHFGPSTFLDLHGKGRKQRTVPLWPHTARVLRNWFEELGPAGGEMAFPNARGHAMSRDGAEYILTRAVDRAKTQCPSLAHKRISPHLLRHTTAMHLLQSGIDIAVIALWLGHESIETTHRYIEADLATKEKALQSLSPVTGKESRFQASDQLLAFLDSL